MIWTAQKASECAMCPRRGKTRLHCHHVLYEQHVRRESGNTRDPRNSLTLCVDCHQRHHDRIVVIPLMRLRDENYLFARELLGEAAYDYLARRYSGRDPRHDRLLAVPTTGEQYVCNTR